MKRFLCECIADRCQCNKNAFIIMNLHGKVLIAWQIELEGHT